MKTKILLIEDEEDLRFNLSEILELNGFMVLHAMDGIEGLEMMNKMEVDIIISDIMMPNMDGLQLLEMVRSNSKWLNIPFIFLSAKVSHKDLRTGMEKGAEDYLTKPVSSKELITAINTALSKKKQREIMVEEAIVNAMSEERNVKYHELRTPLFGLMTILEYLLTSWEQLDNQTIKKLIEKADYSAKRLNESLVKLNKFQEIAQLRAEKKVIPSLINFFKQHVKDEYRPYLTYHVKELDFKLLFDPEQLAFVLNELIGNAIKFGKLNEKIQISLNSDNSCSITNKQESLSENLEITPEPFFQPNRKFQEQQGLGLGLYLAKVICEKNDCKLRLYTDAEAVFHAHMIFDN